MLGFDKINYFCIKSQLETHQEKHSCSADTLRMLHFNITEDSADVQDITERDRGGFAGSSLVQFRQMD